MSGYLLGAISIHADSLGGRMGTVYREDAANGKVTVHRVSLPPGTARIGHVFSPEEFATLSPVKMPSFPLRLFPPLLDKIKAIA